MVATLDVDNAKNPFLAIVPTADVFLLSETTLVTAPTIAAVPVIIPAVDARLRDVSALPALAAATY